MGKKLTNSVYGDDKMDEQWSSRVFGWLSNLLKWIKIKTTIFILIKIAIDLLFLCDVIVNNFNHVNDSDMVFFPFLEVIWVSFFGFVINRIWASSKWKHI